MREVEHVCISNQTPSAELVIIAEYFHNGKSKINPAVSEPSLRYAKYFDSYFGEGEFKRRFGPPEKVETNAAFWIWENFSFPDV